MVSESLEDVIRRIESKFAELGREVVQLRADREMLARELHRVRTERDHLLARREPSSTTQRRAEQKALTPSPQATTPHTRPRLPDASAPRPDPTSTSSSRSTSTAKPSSDRLTDDDWDRLNGNR